MTESKHPDKLFADLEALNEEQIEVGLAAGVWREPLRPLVQHTSMTSNSSVSKLPLTNWMKCKRLRGWQWKKLSKRRRERVRP